MSGYDSGYSGIYTSTNSGLTWTLRSPPGYGWQSVASSADGSKLIAAGEDGLIYTSTNSGFNWSGALRPACTRNWSPFPPTEANSWRRA